MNINHEKIRELLTELVQLSEEEREIRLSELQQSDPAVHDEILSLLPFTTGDREELGNDPIIGEVIGHFTINECIGSGGMGRVYKARQENPPRDVAFKVLRRGLLSRSATKRFEIECRLLGRLHHGGIAQVYEAGTHSLKGERIPWIAMEYIEDATPITTYSTDNNLGVHEKLLCFNTVCEAVAEAHRHGIIHRDLKPANILVDSQGLTKIIDFGVAKAVDPMGLPTELRTQAKDLVGTMQYMSPEQARGEDVDVSSDVYSLGVILYELLSEQPPYDLHSTTIPGAIETISRAEPRPLRTINKTIHRDVETIVSHAMAQDPKKRYRSANELCDDVQHVLDGEPIMARKEWAISKFLRRKRRTAAAIVIALPLLAIATTTSVYFALKAQKELQHKTKLIEFAKDALATRDEIIFTNPEYWETHYDLTIEHAIKLAKGDGLLLAEMHSMLADTADSGDLSNSIRLEIAEYVGFDSEQGILLQIEQYSRKGKTPIEERIKNIKRLSAQVDAPSDEFHALSLVALAKLEIRSEDKTVREEGRQHFNAAMNIIQGREHLFKAEYDVVKTLGWAAIFREQSGEYREYVLELITPEFIERTHHVFGSHHPNSLALQNLIGLAHQELENYDDAIEVLRPAAKVATESYGVGHNLSWRYLNNLAIALALKADHEDTSTETSELLTLQAASLWNECIRQSIMHGDDGCINWYSTTFRDYLPDLAPTEEEIELWRSAIQFNGNPNSQLFDFRSALHR